MTPHKIAELFLGDIKLWFEASRNGNGGVNTNVMAVGLVMIDHMAERFPFDTDYQTPRGQVAGLSGRSVSKILARHGETRAFRSEAGRTSRGSMDLAVQLADVLERSAAAMPYEMASPEDQELVREEIQAWFVARVKAEYLDRQRIQADLDPGKPMRQAIVELLRAARERGGNVGGAVAQHLVGAKLSLRFPGLAISNESYTTADQQTERPGDFRVGDTAFHVTLSPSEHLWAGRCRSNLQHGFRPHVLVPDALVEGSRNMGAEAYNLGDRIAVSGIETFVGTNIEELAEYGAPGIRSALRALLERYNERVSVAELDPSFQIEIPGNL